MKRNREKRTVKKLQNMSNVLMLLQGYQKHFFTYHEITKCWITQTQITNFKFITDTLVYATHYYFYQEIVKNFNWWKKNKQIHIFQLYAASIDEAVCMASRICDGDPHKIPKDCKFINDTKSGKHKNGKLQLELQKNKNNYQ